MCHLSMSVVKSSVLLVAAVACLGHFADMSPHQIHLFGMTLTSPDPSAWPHAPDISARDQRLIEQQAKLYLDSKCYTDTMMNVGGDFLFKSPTNVTVKHLLRLKCDLKPLIVIFSVLLESLQPRPATAREHEQVDFTKIAASGIGLDQSDESFEIWREYSLLLESTNGYVDAAISLMGQRDFCTYSTIDKYSRLVGLTRGSKLLKLAHDLVVADYHTNCLLATIEKLPEVPYELKDVVKMYIDGIEDTRKPDLNDPAYLELEATGFDIDEAIRREGPIDQVASLMLTIHPSKRGDGSLKYLFRSQCRELLIKLEEQWQPMEMMNQMLASDTNSIKQINNMVMQSIIPQKYAQVCSQLSLKA